VFVVFCPSEVGNVNSKQARVQLSALFVYYRQSLQAFSAFLFLKFTARDKFQLSAAAKMQQQRL
jgi:hypothetical protein